MVSARITKFSTSREANCRSSRLRIRPCLFHSLLLHLSQQRFAAIGPLRLEISFPFGAFSFLPCPFTWRHFGAIDMEV